MKIRLIIVTDDNGVREEVTFTEEFDAPVSDYIFPEGEVTFDDIIEMEVPSLFPLEYTLRRN